MLMIYHLLELDFFVVVLAEFNFKYLYTFKAGAPTTIQGDRDKEAENLLLTSYQMNTAAQLQAGCHQHASIPPTFPHGQQEGPKGFSHCFMPVGTGVPTEGEIQRDLPPVGRFPKWLQELELG